MLHQTKKTQSLMKKMFLSLFLMVAILLPATVVFSPLLAQEVEVEVVTLVEEVIIIPADPDEDIILPDVPWGFDFDAYYLTWLTFVGLILAITQIFKKILNWKDDKAYWLSMGIAVIVTGIGWFFKLGAMATMEWYGPIVWFIAFALGTKYGYKFLAEFLARLPLNKAKV